MRKGKEEGEREKVEQLGEMQADFMAAPIADDDAAVNRHENTEQEQQEDVRPSQEEKHAQVLKGHGVDQEKLKNLPEF